MSDHKIEDWNDIRGVVFDLAVQALVKLENVITVDVKNTFINISDFLELLDVVGSLTESFIVHVFIIFVVFDLLKVVYEILQLHLDFICVDIGSPDDLSG